MARVNIETQWWSDPRRMKLILKVGFEADSAAVNMWRTAQEYWGRSFGLVPKSIFDTLEHSAVLIECGLADIRGDQVYVRGSNQHLSWLHEQREQAKEAGKKGGKKSVEIRKKKYGTAIPSGARNRIDTEALAEANSEPNRSSPKPSDSGSYSVSDSFSDSSSGSDLFSVVSAGLKEPQTRSAKELSPTTRVWRSYGVAFEARYRSPATWNAKVAGQIKQFVSRVPASEAPEIAAFYVGHNGSRYVASGHSTGLMLQDAEKLRTEWLSGRKITSMDVRHSDTADSLKNQIERLTGGSK